MLTDTANRLSEINAFTFVTLERQYGLWFDHALYLQDNAWFSLGRLRFQSFPLLYHGIGPESPDTHLAQVNANLINVRERETHVLKGWCFFFLLFFNISFYAATHFSEVVQLMCPRTKAVQKLNVPQLMYR